MTKNPLINAFLATLYIFLVSFILFFGTIFKVGNNSLIAPVALISLFTLSAAVMGYLFCYQPIQLYFDGKKKQAVRLFLQTIGTFGGLTLFLLFLLFSGIFS